MRLSYLAGGIIALVVGGCTPREEALAPDDRDKDRVVLVIHGGAGVLNEKEMEDAKLKQEEFEKGLADALAAGYDAWKKKKSSVDMVEEAIRVMEDSPLFNAGKGCALNEDGQPELDAAIMEGNMDQREEGPPLGKRDPRKRAGAVAAVGHIKNPISAARAVMEMRDQRQPVLLVGVGAEMFVFSKEVQERYPGRIKQVPNVYFWTPRRLKEFPEVRKAFKEEEEKRKENEKKRQKLRPSQKAGTVGAVALDMENNLAAGTSTGGLTNKMRGRVGDSPLIGAGTYADKRACGVSCTGTGEVFIRHAVAHDVVARMLYGKCDVETAVQKTIEELPDEKDGVGGLIALDHKGRQAFGMSKLSDGMYRGYVTEKGVRYVAVSKGKPRKWTGK
jgi:beta-aspartyl-peptidase (threonine type)